MRDAHPAHGVVLLATTRNDDGDRISVKQHTSDYLSFPVIEYEVEIDNEDGSSTSLFLNTDELRVLLATIGRKL